MSRIPVSAKRVSLSRRAFLQGSALVMSSAPAIAGSLLANEAPAQVKLRIGLVTDLHYADKVPAGTRFYRETPGKLRRAIEQFTADKVDLTVELGDLVDAAASITDERGYLTTIHAQLATLKGDRHYVLGNHCVQTLTKAEFLASVEREKSHYSFDAAGWHFVVLDACFRSDGEPYGRNNFTWTDATIPDEQLKWLEADLEAADGQTIVFVHQRLDATKQHSVKNAAAVRKVLSSSGDVAAVFQGHSHQNDYQELDGIHYCTLAAMVEGSGQENNSFARLDLLADGGINVEGFVRQKSYDWNQE